MVQVCSCIQVCPYRYVTVQVYDCAGTYVTVHVYRLCPCVTIQVCPSVPCPYMTVLYVSPHMQPLASPLPLYRINSPTSRLEKLKKVGDVHSMSLYVSIVHKYLCVIFAYVSMPCTLPACERSELLLIVFSCTYTLRTSLDCLT